MQCPYCNSEMEKGIINQDRYPLKWKSEGPNAKKIKLTSQISKNGFLEIKVPAKFSGKIYSYFAMSSATKYGGLLSLLTFVSLLIILSTKTFRKRKLSKDK